MNDGHTIRQLLRFGLVGLVSNGVLYALYLLVTGVGVEAKLAMTLLYAVGVAQTFIFNKRWTFDHRGARSVAFVRYCLSYALGYVTNLAVLYAFVDRLGYPHQIVQGVMILSLAIMLFVLQKLWVFAPARRCQSPG